MTQMQFNQTQRVALCSMIQSIGYRGCMPIDECIERLTKVGIACGHVENAMGIKIVDYEITADQSTEFASAISGWDLLIAVITLENLDVSTRMSGNGFRFTDLLEQVGASWSVKLYQ